MSASYERVGRVAAASVLGVVTGLVLLGICDDYARAAGVWLGYTLVCAFVINSERGERASVLALLAAFPALVPPLVLVFPLAFLSGDLCFSAVHITAGAYRFVSELAAFFFGVSFIAIVLFAFARSWFLIVVKSLTNPELVTRLKTFDKVLRTAATVVGSVGLLYLAVKGS